MTDQRKISELTEVTTLSGNAELVFVKYDSGPTGPEPTPTPSPSPTPTPSPTPSPTPPSAPPYLCPACIKVTRKWGNDSAGYMGTYKFHASSLTSSDYPMAFYEGLDDTNRRMIRIEDQIYPSRQPGDMTWTMMTLNNSSNAFYAFESAPLNSSTTCPTGLSFYGQSFQNGPWTDEGYSVSSVDCPTPTPTPSPVPSPTPTPTPTPPPPSPAPAQLPPLQDGQGPPGTWTIFAARDLWFNDQAAAIATYGHIRNWNVSEVVDMHACFYNRPDFNEDISGWDTSSVTNMNNMFYKATSFNQDIGGWDVSSVWDFRYTFRDATSFNQDISGWDVSSADHMSHMFYGASSFTQDLSSWNVNDREGSHPNVFDCTGFNLDAHPSMVPPPFTHCTI